MNESERSQLETGCLEQENLPRCPQCKGLRPINEKLAREARENKDGRFCFCPYATRTLNRADYDYESA